jgi:glycosyltransferase involved in cell wall biosynthesis
MKVLTLIGPIPEPKGGVSIHISRLQFIMSESFKIQLIDESPIKKSNVFNIRSGGFFKYINLLVRSDIIHIHSSSSLLRLIHTLTAKLFFKKTIITLHAFRHKKMMQLFINKIICKICCKVIVVNKEIAKTLKLKEFVIKPAFIPPNLNSEPSIPENVSNWLYENRRKNRSILTANAFRIDFHDGIDIYGVDLCIDALDELVNKKGKKEICMIFVVSSLSNKNTAFEKYQRVINEKKLTEYFLLVNQSMSFVSLIQDCDIVIRPTCTDGDALTIREAQHIGKRIIASDVVERPTGTILFKTRNFHDLALRIEQTLLIPENDKYSQDSNESYINFYTGVYLD